ncbi:hypothetical protein ART_3067 [Arthrobacter sp. PAMC 25486]|uniref:TadE family type IV pilus minor pilin n=1 Tax=Arthrobacter sp. PAMC 25486 TaxID=1494608 RepID=UPI000535A1D7|nr:TadE family type IV pilus minor pilin [Arthrobacter sp. PAMC 25486]AIY02666.1 hypothetical protein ART_3067 [Arthrobacter sp. PAMC 25486]
MNPTREKDRMRGSATAELAVVLPAITVLLAVLLLSVSGGLLQLRLEEGARAGARALARGDSSEQVLAIVSRVSGANTTASIGASAGFATVTVEGRVGGVLSGLVPWTQAAQASTRLENASALAAATFSAVASARGYALVVPGCPAAATVAGDHGQG